LGNALRAVSLGLLLAGPTLWACLALWLDGPASRPLAGLLAAGFALGSLVVLLFVRPLRRAAALWAAAFAAVLLGWLALPPRNDRAWQPEVARLPFAELDGDRVVLHNVRNFEYRSETDFTPRWEDRTYDLSRLVGQDLFLSFWGPTLIAHTIMSWEFDDGQHLAISIETRKEQGEAYSALRGFFRQYELYYVVADERDVIGVRANHRGETVYLYRLPASPERGRALLRDYLETVNDLAREPRWYNALTHNCTTSIRVHVLNAGRSIPLDWRLFLNGHLDEYLYELGAFDRGVTLSELRRRSDVTAKARAADSAAQFSQRIRDGLPPRPGRGSARAASNLQMEMRERAALGGEGG
jgi:hypothetical protein